MRVIQIFVAAGDEFMFFMLVLFFEGPNWAAAKPFHHYLQRAAVLTECFQSRGTVQNIL